MPSKMMVSAVSDTKSCCRVPQRPSSISRPTSIGADAVTESRGPGEMLVMVAAGFYFAAGSARLDDLMSLSFSHPIDSNYHSLGYAPLGLGHRCYSACGKRVIECLAMRVGRSLVTQPARLWVVQPPLCHAVRPLCKFKEKHMRPLFRQFVSVAALILIATFAAAQTQDAVLQEITLSGTVEAIDHTARTVRIRGAAGNVVTLDVPASVTRFDQVKVGDHVTIGYYDRVGIKPKPAGEAAVDRTYESDHHPHTGIASRGYARDSARHDGHHRCLGSDDENGDLHHAKRPIHPPRERTARRQRDRRAQGGRPSRRDSHRGRSSQCRVGSTRTRIGPGRPR